MASVSSHPVFAHFPYLRKASIWAPQGPSGVRYRLPPRRWLSSHLLPRPGFGNFHTRCSITDTDVSFSHVVADTEVPREDLRPVDSDPLLPIVHLKSEILESDCLSLLAEATDVDCVLTVLPVLSKEEQKAIAATPAHPNGLYALYASCLCANLVEQLWNFAWPSAIAMLHPSLLPVAVIGFFSKVTIIIGGPLVGKIMDSSPRMPAFIYLNIVQAAAQLLSALMIICAYTGSHGPPSSILIRPWFITLVVVGAIERLCGVASGVATERDWVVLLAGINRPIALAKANAVLSRIDLLCEIAGASIFGVLLSRYDTVTCLKFAAGLMILSLPVIIALSLLTNKLSSGVLDHNRFAQPWYKEAGGADSTNPFSLVHRSLETIKLGWKEYMQQPVLPASLAFVLLFFNVVLAPGSLMTAFLTQRGVNPSIVGGFSGLCSFMGVAATFVSAILVRHLGILQAGAAGLILQASLLCGAVVVYLAGSLTQNSSLIFFLGLIVLSRLGNMAYDVIGQQILQTGIPSGKANLIGATEVSVASLAESLMLGIAIFANDVSHFGILAMLSLLSVAGAAWMFCRWLLNPTEEQRRLFSFEPPYS